MQGSGNKTNEGIRSKRVLLFRFAAFLINYASYFYPDGSSFQPLCGPLHSYLQVNYFVFVVKPFRFKVFNAFDLASSSSFCQFATVPGYVVEVSCKLVFLLLLVHDALLSLLQLKLLVD